MTIQCAAGNGRAVERLSRNAGASVKLISLIYHDVASAPTARHYAVTIADFRSHLAAIKATAAGAPAITNGTGDMTGFALTFDDGSKGWVEAAEALQELQWKAFFFVISGLVGKAGMVDRSDIRRLAEMGHVIGTHTVDHPENLTKHDDSFIVDQWSRSKAALEDILGREVATAAVPGGYYDARVGRAADAAGVKYLFTSEPVSSSWDVGGCRVLGRFLVANGMSSRRVARIAAGARVERARQYLSWNIKKLVKPFTVLPYRALRKRLRPS